MARDSRGSMLFKKCSRMTAHLKNPSPMELLLRGDDGLNPGPGMQTVRCAKATTHGVERGGRGGLRGEGHGSVNRSEALII